MLNGAKRGAISVFKASKDFARGDVLCGGLCCVLGFEVISSVLVWCPIPGKVMVV